MKAIQYAVTLVFEPACNAHWMKDVVQFPNALSKLSGCEKALLITRPNRWQEILREHINLEFFGEEEKRNIPHFERVDFSNIIYDVNWYHKSCKLAAEKSPVLVLYPWYGDFSEGAKNFKKHCRFKKPLVILKTDGLLKLQSGKKAGIRQRWKDFFTYRNIDHIVCENKNDHERLLITNPHLAHKIIYIPNCPLDLYGEQLPELFSKRENYFLFVGRADDPEKGLDILMNAWMLAGKKLRGWKLIIAGPCSAELKSFWVEQLTLKDMAADVEWPGNVAPEKLLPLYNSVKVVVCPSRKESGPIILSESVLSGCAFIGAAVGEIPDYLREAGGLVERTEDWPQVLIDFATIPGMAEQQATQLYQTMKNRNWQHVVSALAGELDIS